jgi:enoyl-CoA hydratase/carnithine racemase
MSDAALTSLHLHHPLHQEDGGPDLRVLAVELNHGRANEMGKAELLEWAALTARLQQGEVRALITYSRRRSASGKGIFISGANVTERVGWTDDQIKAHVRWQRATLAALRAAPVLHIAVVDGVAFGWGTEFLLTADYRIGGPDGRYALPETGIGILPGAGGTSELWSMVGVAQALRLGMTGEVIDSAEACRIGLIQETAPSVDAGLARALDLAKMVARRSPTAVAAFKSGLLASVGEAPALRGEVEARAYEACVESGDAAIGRANFKALTSGGEVPWGPLRPFKP